MLQQLSPPILIVITMLLSIFYKKGVKLECGFPDYLLYSVSELRAKPAPGEWQDHRYMV